MDKSSIGGVFLAVAGILAGLLMEGGHLAQILQPTAAIIVLGGTMGAVLLQFPAWHRSRSVSQPRPCLHNYRREQQQVDPAPRCS